MKLGLTTGLITGMFQPMIIEIKYLKIEFKLAMVVVLELTAMVAHHGLKQSRGTSAGGRGCSPWSQPWPWLLSRV